METRRTKKFYRDEINKSFSSACAVFNEAFKKYATNKGDYYTYRTAVSNNWNGQIDGFGLYKYKTVRTPRGKFKRVKLAEPEMYIDLYVQGDDTDTCTEQKLSDALRYGCKGKLLESFNDGYEHMVTASFTKDHIWQAMKNFANDCLK